MGVVTPGFRGRARSGNPRLPPGQYLAEDFPVLSAGPTPRVRTETWEFTVTTETGAASGRTSATTTTGIHGANSGIRATSLAGRPPGRVPRRDADGPHTRLRPARLAGAPGGAARRRPAHRGRRLPRAAQLLARR